VKVTQQLFGFVVVDQRGDGTARRVMALDRVSAVKHGLGLTPIWHRPAHLARSCSIREWS
jgi:hypothetical protein